VLIDVVHTTRFSYTEAIEESVVEAWLEPRTDADQRRLRFSLDIQPRSPVFSYSDAFENAVHCLSVLPPHRALTITARSQVDTYLSNPFAPPERVPQPLDEVDAWLFLQFGGPVLCVPGVESLAARFQPAGPEHALEALGGLMRYIRETFTYEQEVTTVTSTVEDLLKLGRGVCQDFAHLMIAVCRAMRVPARYVSGYILGDPVHASRGSAASHAWCEAHVPGYGWRGFDPTNNLLAADRHVKVGVGRAYPDVPPTRGTYRGSAEKRIAVEVATRIVDSDGA
jgi:transglutaminase-like putative cysteine protease